MKTSEQINEIAFALSIAQGKITPANKSKKNSHYTTKYSNITNIFDAIREPLAECALCVIQEAGTNDVGVSITTRIIHKSGQWIECGPFTIPFSTKTTKHDAQSIGSAISYAKRYALCAALGIVSSEDDKLDDDGESLMNRTKQYQPPAQEQAPAKEPEKEKPIEYITQKRANELFDILKDCSQEARDKVNNFIIDNYDNDILKMRVETMDKWIAQALKSREINIKNKIIEQKK